MAPQARSQLPEGSREHTFLIYDAESGEVVHGHRAVVLPHDAAPSFEALERQALELAAQATERDASSLRALAVSYEELEPEVHYRVDVARGSLIRGSSR